MQLRASTSLRKRLDKLATSARACRIRVPGGVIQCGTEELDARNARLFEALAELPDNERGGYLFVPAIVYDLDEWEARALEAQEQLMRDTGEWLGPPPPVVTGKDPDDVTHLYKPNPALVKP